MSEHLPRPLAAFHAKLLAILACGCPPLSKLERLWLRAFREAADRFRPYVNRDESYALSFDALRDCYVRQTAGCFKYLRRACITAHWDYVKPSRRVKAGPLPHDLVADHDWAGVDDRLDLEEALRGLGRHSWACERAVRLRLRGLKVEDIAADMNLCKRQALRVLRKGERHLREALGENDD
jgi:hypothetical protein